jgi:hypothetical protein
MGTRGLIWLTSLSLVLVGMCGIALAGPRAEGNAHYKNGNAAFDARNYATALREYEAAYGETSDADILFNLAQAARFSDQFERAKKAYSDYLTQFPNTEDKDAIREQIAQLDELIRHMAQVKVSPPVGRAGSPKSPAVDPPAAGADHPDATPPLGNKRVLLLITEQNGNDIVHAWTDVVWTPFAVGVRTGTPEFRAVNELGVVEATLSDKMTDAGFNVVDANVLKGRMGPPARFEKILGDDEARAVALHSCADLVLVAKGVGRIAAAPALAGSGMLSGQANVTARLIRVADGVVIASAAEHAAQVHIDADTARMNALSEAAKLVATKITGRANAL